MTGSWETNSAGERTWQNNDAHLSSGEGKGYSSSWTGQQKDGEEGPM
jgi:hypothetical protein